MNYGSLEQHIAFQLHLTWRAARKALLAQVAKGTQPVARGSYSIPILIGLNPGITPMQLASALHLDASKVAFVLRDLDKQGLVERRKSEEDRRVVQLHLTARGEEFTRMAAGASEELESPFESILDTEEKDTLIALLAKLRSGLS